MNKKSKLNAIKTINKKGAYTVLKGAGIIK